MRHGIYCLINAKIRSSRLPPYTRKEEMQALPFCMRYKSEVIVYAYSILFAFLSLQFSKDIFVVSLNEFWFLIMIGS